MHVLEKAGPEQGPQAFVGFVAIVPFAGRELEIGPDGFGLDTGVAHNPDVADDRPALRERLRRLHRRSCDCHRQHSRENCKGRTNPSDYAFAQHRSNCPSYAGSPTQHVTRLVTSTL